MVEERETEDVTGENGVEKCNRRVKMVCINALSAILNVEFDLRHVML
jgi:hypothetical protein